MDPWHSGMHAVRSPLMTRTRIDGAFFFFYFLTQYQICMVSALPQFPFFPCRISLLTMVLGGLEGGIGRLPRYVHGHSQRQCHSTEPAELQERDLPG